ncbi:PLP-dependent transferase [Sodiomyces alkalinus F11]|uniref:PLP-dependent transferase n=1 Tax=Sodiomyces alkalinus (strain CBS 110278 / VKM F-3762 / F11) TaxID=1314773 RepID=A0A3N2PQP4_SODAK|nr:PLP-dependent transferase [Sodiomyces alkalinus F11]ROT36780.1 PLP-dependent transferase [Sodiomyces alkalinus F11]
MACSSQNSSVFHRSLHKPYPTAVGGEGVYLFTADGRKILDGSCGAAVSGIGHGNKEVIEAVCEQMRRLAYIQTSFFTTDPAEALASAILENSDGAFSKVMFLSSGSEAVESALKMARQYHVYNGQPERVHVVGRHHSYHGNTLGALAAGHNPSRRDTFAPILSPAFHHVRRCFYQADGGGSLSEAEYEDELLAEYEETFKRLGPETVAAVIVEPVVGATLGAAPATPNYLPRLSKLCRSYGILTIFDEIMCGMGRVGTYHAWQSLGGVSPDLQTVGKGLGAGYQPLSAVLVGPTVHNAFQEHSKGSNGFISGHTFQGHPAACAGALAVQKILKRDNLISKCGELGQVLHDALESQLPEELSQGGGKLRGMGLFRAVDFGDMGASYGGPLAEEVATKAFDLGASVYLCSPNVDAILICPPFISTEEEIKELARITIQAVKEVLERKNASQE